MTQELSEAIRWAVRFHAGLALTTEEQRKLRLVTDAAEALERYRATSQQEPAMTDEQAALAWLHNVSTGSLEGLALTKDSAANARVLKARLASPRLPAEPSEDVLQAMRAMEPRINAYAFYRALRAHLAGDKPAEPAITPHQGEQIIAALGEMRDLLSRCLDNIGR
jgi:hypothetical protein